MADNSILDIFLNNAESAGARTAALVKRDGAYRELSWRALADESRTIASGLIAFGVAPGDRVALVSQTRVEWVTADMGILGAGAISVPIYPSNLPDECQFIIENSGAVVVIVEDATQAQKLRTVRSSLPSLRKVIQLTGEVSPKEELVVSLAELGALPRASSEELNRRQAALNRGSPLTIIYTSGTTGRPKGVVLTHDAMLYEAQAIRDVDIVRPDDVQLLFLPLAHVFARVLEMAWLSVGFVTAFAESLQTIRENLRETRPTFMAGVPRVFEKFYNAVVQKGTGEGGAKAKLFLAAARLSDRNGEAEARGQSLPLGDALKFAALKPLVFSKIERGLKEMMGGRMRFVVSGGAPLSPKIGWFFRDSGLMVLEGYGLTETSAATFVNRPGQNRIGTVGPPLPGTEVRIADDGEVLIKGRGVMKEYWNNPAATAEMLRDGWFATGDIGTVDEHGHLKITDRKKDIIVTAGGKNVAPQNIENLLKTNKLISQVVVHGDKRKFVSALITLEPDALRGYARDHKLGDVSYSELTQKVDVQREVQRIIDEFNARLASYESIKKFKILEHDFSQETGEMTPSLKVKRKVINERYKAIFDGFYEERY